MAQVIARGFSKIRLCLLCLCAGFGCLATGIGAAPLLAQQAVQPAGPLVSVRASEQEAFSRLIFAFPAPVTYQAVQSGTIITLQFTGVFNINIRPVLAQPMRGFRNPRVQQTGQFTQLLLDVPVGTSLRHLRSGSSVVVDIEPPAGQSIAEAGFKDAPQRNESGQVVAPAPAQAQVQAQAQVTPTQQENRTGSTDTPPAPAVSTGAEPTEADAIDGAARAAANSDAADGVLDGSGDGLGVDTSDIGASVQDEGIDDIQAGFGEQYDMVIDDSLSSARAQTVNVSVNELSGGMQLRFEWPQEVAAATFERGNALWLVFDRRYGLNISGIDAARELVSRRISRINVIDHPDALVIVLSTKENQNFLVERERTHWLVSFKDTPAVPRFPLTLSRRVDPTEGQQLFISVNNIGRQIEIEDPIVGDYLVVLPLSDEGRGIAESYSTAVTQIPNTAQGVVVVPLTDDVSVKRYRDGIAITSPEGNLFPDTADVEIQNIVDDSNRLINLASWRIGPEYEYRKFKARILYELSVADTDAEVEEARWKLARYYLGHSRAPEALGVMELMIEDNPAFERDARFLAARGLAYYRMGHYNEAEEDLTSRVLINEQDISLWRVRLYETLGDHQEALDNYRRGRDVVGTLDERDRIDVQLAVIRSAIETNDIEIGQREMALLRGLRLSERQQADAELLAGVLLQMTGQEEDALVQFDQLANSPVHRVSANARYKSVTESLDRGEISKDVAVEELERLRYAWRGDRFEIQLMDDLGRIYYDLARYADALDIMRQAISFYPSDARDRRLLLRMTNIFRELYLDGKADSLSPIAAISLWLRFRDLTPLGAEGDLMIRRLAGRLVEVELLDRAAELLEYQVSERLEGVARAQVAARLASIYVLDEQAQKALQILRATREPQLPADVDRNRRLVEARALIALAQYEEAEVLLENDLSFPAEQIRAEIYWSAQNWDKIASTNRRLLGDGWQRQEPLTDDNRIYLMRLTIALTFLEDRDGLIELRSRYLTQMRVGNFANGFNLLTSDQQLTGQELSLIASQIASVEKLQDFIRDYREDFDEN